MSIDKNIVELFEKAQKGDREAVTSIVEDNIGLVYKQAKKFKGKAISYDDAIQVGSLGLLYSIQNYDPTLNVKFSTYATTNIVGKILKEFRDNRDDVPFRIPRRNYNQYKQIKQIRKKFESLQREPTLKELSEIMGITIEEITKTLHLMEGKIPMDSPIKLCPNERKITYSETIRDISISEDKIISKIDLLNAMKKLSKLEKTVIEMKFFEGKTQSEIAVLLNDYQSHISRVEISALKNLRRILEGENKKDNSIHRNKNRFIDVATIDLNCLTARQRSVIELVFIEGLTQAETARRLGIHRANVCLTIKQVISKLEKLEKKKIS